MKECEGCKQIRKTKEKRLDKVHKEAVEGARLECDMCIDKLDEPLCDNCLIERHRNRLKDCN